ncbi:MAG: helix-turn-helix domain-containing protein [bacterium]|nr:helix-turn-helix domain-containing protein [bacterium]
MIKIERNRRIKPAVVIEAVAYHFRISVADLLGQGRSQPLARCRQLAMYLIREICGSPFLLIAQVLGRENHTTAIHGYKVVKRLLANGDSLDDDAYRIVQALEQLAAAPAPVKQVSAEVPALYADAPTLDALAVRLVSEELKVSVVEIEGMSRKPKTVEARAVAMRLLRDVGWSVMDIARAFGCDHSTVIRALSKLEKKILSDRDLNVRVTRIAAQFKRIPRFHELSDVPP